MASNVDPTDKSDRNESPPLLIPRSESARLLAVSHQTIRRMERRGVLRLIRLTKKGRAFNALSEVKALVSR
jgi:hypothetical protein